MGGIKSVGKAIGKVGKSLSKSIGKVVGDAFSIAKGIATGEYIAKITGNVVKVVGNSVVDDILGMDKLGSELAQVGVDIAQVGKVLGGEYHDDVKKITEYKEQLDAKAAEYNASLDTFADRMESLVAFHEVFQMALGNQMDEYIAKYNPQLQAMMKEYQAMVARLQSEYDFVIGLTQGNFLERIVGSLLMIVGGIMSDMGDVLSGKADGETWKRIIVDILLIIAIVFMWWNPVGWFAVTMAILGTIGVFMQLDGMYANGAATGAIMGMLDTIFNDVLNLDDIIGKDFDKFDKDHEDYQEMVMYTQLALALAGMSAGLTSGPPGTTNVTEMVSTENGFVAVDSAAGQAALGVEPSSYLGGALKIGGSMSTNSFLGVSFGTYSDIYKAYSTAQSIGDTVAANDQYEDLKDKLLSDSTKVQDAIDSKYRKNFMKHYKDSAYFLQDQQEYIDRYLWSMTANNMYVDPYGTTPVANSRFTPDKRTRIMSFGFEDVFDESKQAGSKGYFNSILYG
jgi:hypothetical protein